ncbi:MAG: biotin/lipoyl-binding protein [Clostridia bacterium]
MRNKLALKGLCIFFAAMALLTIVGRVADSLLIANVNAQPALRSTLNHEATSEGVVAGIDPQMVWARKGLRVTKVPVSDGTQVKNGDILVEFESESANAQLSEAQASLQKLVNERAQLELDAPGAKEEKKLKQHKLKLDALDLSIHQARKALRGLEALRSSGYRVVAPTDGVITKLNIQAGMATGDEALMQLAGMNGGLTLRCSITRDEAKYALAGDTVQLTPSGETQPKRAQVKSVSLTDDSGRVEVVIALPDEGYAIGMHCAVGFSKKTDSYATVVPRSSLRSDSQGDFVLVLRNKKSVLGDTQVAERVQVMVQDKDAQRVAISGAIMETDLIITGWDKAVESGDRVRRVET